MLRSTINTTDMTSLISFVLFYFITELHSFFMVMTDISKTVKTIILEIPSLIFFLLTIFVYQLNCALFVPFFFGQV